jgi:hypothetical protein
MDVRLLGGLMIFQALLTAALVLTSRDLAVLPIAAFLAGAGLIVWSRVGQGGDAAADRANGPRPGAGPGAVDPRAPTPPAAVAVPEEPRVLVHGQGRDRKGPPSTHEAAVGEATEAKSFVPDFSAQAMPGLVDIHREIQKGAIRGYLLVVAGPNRGAGVALRDGAVSVGRAQDSTLQLTDGRVSNQQCSVVWRDGAAFAIDAASRNGTFVNNVRIAGETRLANCDVLAFGGTKIMVALPLDDSDRDGDRAEPHDVTVEQRPAANL